VTVPNTRAASAQAPLLAELEITRRCAAICPKLCYVQAGPTQAHSPLPTPEWLAVIDAIATRTAKGSGRVQFIGGDPLLHPDIGVMIGHALDRGLAVEVATTFVRVSARLWALLAQPGVTVAVSYHSSVPEEHDAITGLSGSHGATRANIAEAIRRGIPVRGQVVEVEAGQHAAEAETELLALGVAKVSRDRSRPIGNAGLTLGRPPRPSDLCGRCAENRLAVLVDGTIAPCVLGRFLVAGNVANSDLDAVLDSRRWWEIRQMVKAGRGTSCAPADSNDCNPAIVLGRVCPPADGNNCDPNDSDDI
jgi:hypothetical protein